LTGEELEDRLAGTIGETLKLEPGVSSTFFGAGASRPHLIMLLQLKPRRLSVLKLFAAPLFYVLVARAQAVLSM